VPAITQIVFSYRDDKLRLSKAAKSTISAYLEGSGEASSAEWIGRYAAAADDHVADFHPG
jgi:hypothetical protein